MGILTIGVVNWQPSFVCTIRADCVAVIKDVKDTKPDLFVDVALALAGSLVMAAKFQEMLGTRGVQAHDGILNESLRGV